ncbi:MAG TPA: hypothetical protein VFS05_07255 [Gemmatimonadaceae bacterium]|nr:hypothetical protein [Gemmatimonadaceae bacterium]
MRPAKAFEAGKTKDDASFEETIRRAELQATADALADLGQQMAAFLTMALRPGS